MNNYLVGGAVRDQLLGLAVHERDWVVVGAHPQQLLDLGYQQVGKDFPVFLHPKTKEEYALARTERKSGHGYHGFEIYADENVTLEDDLIRRDLTINAIAQDNSGTLYDPHNGQKDLQDRILRHVSPAFSEDPVRVLRIARFAARLGPLNFTVAPETNQLMRNMVANGEVDHLVSERVWKELERALSDAQPWRFIEVLRECHALAALFPEIDTLFGVPQREEYHPEIDTGIHTLMVLEQASLLSDDPQVRFAALVHDLGKGNTPKDLLPRHHGHEGRGIKLVKRLCERLKAPTDYRDLARLVAQFHTHCHRAFELRPKTLLETLGSLDAFRRPDRLDKFLIACKADARGRTGFEDIPYAQADYFKAAFEAAQTVDTRSVSKQVMAEGLKGPAIKKAIDQARIDAITQLKRSL